MRLDLIMVWIHLIIKQSILILLFNYQKGVGVYNRVVALSSHTFIYHRVKAYHSMNSLGLQVIHLKLFYYFITTLLQGNLPYYKGGKDKAQLRS